MRDLPSVRHEQLGVFTSAQAQACGWSRHQTQRLLDTGELLALRRGVYTDRVGHEVADTADRSRMRAVAACLARPGSVISHHSAALIHDLAFIGSRPAIPALTFPSTTDRHGECHRTVLVRGNPLADWQISRRGTWSVTSVARTVCDLAREQQPMTALVAIDASLNGRLTTMEELCHVRDSLSAWPGINLLNELLRRADPGAESPYETVARWQLRRAGLGGIAQVWAYDLDGPIGCGDLWLPSLWTFLEVDGDVKYSAAKGVDTLLEEKLRQERLEEAGFGVARVAAREARDRELIVQRVSHAASRGRLARTIMRDVRGYVGPPPEWAQRGAHLPRTLPPESIQDPA